MQIKSIYGDYKVEFRNIQIDILNPNNQSFMIVDSKIKELYSIPDNKRILVIKPVEQMKEYESIKRHVEYLINMGIRRNDVLIGIGGGIIQDITGFISSILYRGIEWYYYPTTLLSQADSCIGGKTSINLDNYKNLIGTFYPPKKIIMDTKFLKTLSSEELDSGYGEIIKYHLLDNNYHFYNKLDAEIKYCLKVKQKYIEEDELDQNIRKHLNYGHTFGHAIETNSNYTIPHGIAILMGIDISNFISFKSGYIDEYRYLRMTRFYERYKVKISNLSKNLDLSNLMIALQRDKKNISDQLSIIIPFKERDFKLEEVPYDCIKSLIKEYIKS
jgi:3-dehydroquinate synthase